MTQNKAITSYKSLFGIYCQKNGHVLPKYDAVSIGDDHCLKWHGIINVTIDNETYNIQSKKNTSKKTDSHDLVVIELCEILEINLEEFMPKNSILKLIDEINNKSVDVKNSSIIIKKIVKFDLNIVDTIYLIDLENIGGPTKYHNNILYIGCTVTDHHSYDKWNDWIHAEELDIGKYATNDNNRILYDIYGGVADLADHLMSALCVPIVNFINVYPNINNIFVLTKDHAGFCTSIIFSKILADKLNIKKLSKFPV